jgi:3'(2'), 5'-bisphosphate nucleotidase
MSSRENLTQILETMIDVARKAGDLVLPLFLEGCSKSTKADGSIVTIADTQAETLITKALSASFPHVGFLGEEGTAAGLVPDLSGAYFCVDPIDGTQQFAKGDPEWVIAIGYLEQGRPLAGVIFAPAMAGRLFAGLADFGGFEILPDGTRQPFPSDNAVPETWRALQGAYGKPVSLARFLPKDQAISVTQVGSAVKFGLISIGEADVFVRPGQVWDWDIAAGQAIIEAAGGKVLDMQGKELVYGQAQNNYRHPPFIARRKGLML